MPNNISIWLDEAYFYERAHIQYKITYLAEKIPRI